MWIYEYLNSFSELLRAKLHELIIALCSVQMVLNSYRTFLSLDESFLPLLSNKSDILPWILKRLEMALSNHHQLLVSYKLKGKWVNMGSHKEYLTSHSMSFFICTDFHTKMFLAVLKMYIWINQLSPTPAPFEAFLSIALFSKGYINKIPANSQMHLLNEGWI